LAQERQIKQKFFTTKANVERAFLVGVGSRASNNDWSVTDSLQELSYLTKTAGANVAGMLTQKLDAPSPTYYIGKGKIEELISLKEQTPYDTVIFDDELSPRQQRNLEEALGVKVIDRSALILHIFARKARTHEGKLQVELAQHQYLLPRLIGQWRHLERLGGQQFLITDTVGFIHKLPPSIIAAFRATLEELDEADLLLHIVDITHKNAANQCLTVEKILSELNLENKPKMTVFNKLDLALNSEAELNALTTIPCFEEEIVLPNKGVALVSAAKGWGIDKLLNKIASYLGGELNNVTGVSLLSERRK